MQLIAQASGSLSLKFKSQESNADGFDPENDGYESTMNPYDALGPTVAANDNVSNRPRPSHSFCKSSLMRRNCPGSMSMVCRHSVSMLINEKCEHPQSPNQSDLSHRVPPSLQLQEPWRGVFQHQRLAMKA